MTQLIINNKSSNTVYTALICINSPNQINLPVLSDFTPREVIATTNGFSNKAHIYCLEPKGEKYVLLCMWSIDDEQNSKPESWAVYDSKTSELVNSNFKTWKSTLTNNETNYFITLVDGPKYGSLRENPYTFLMSMLMTILLISILFIVLWQLFISN
jgi:hypothetical protein